MFKRLLPLLLVLVTLFCVTGVASAEEWDINRPLEAGQYDVQLSYTENGTTVSTVYTIDVWGPAEFTTDLAAETKYIAGELSAALAVEATGGWPEVYSYQWWKKPAVGENDTTTYVSDVSTLTLGSTVFTSMATSHPGFQPIAGATSATLALTGVDPTAAGSQYLCTVANGKWETPVVSTVTTLVPVAPTSISVPVLNATEFKEGSGTIDTAASYVDVGFADSSSKRLYLNSSYLTVTGFDNTADVGVTSGQTVTVTYDDTQNTPVSSSVDVTIVPKMLTGAVIMTQPDKVSYKELMDFDKTGLVVKLTYDNGTFDTLTADQVPIVGEDLAIGTPSVSYTFVKNEGTLYESSATLVVPITVAAKEAESLTILSQPTKTKYRGDEALSWDGISVQVNWDNGTQSIALDSELVFADLSAIRGVRGSHSMTITRDTASTSVTFDVFTFEGIHVGTTPSNATVEKGDASLVDFDDGTLKLEYTNGVTSEYDEVSMQGAISGVDFSSNVSQDVTLTYMGDTVTIPVTAVYGAGSTATLLTKPDKMWYYKGESVDLSGLTVQMQSLSGYGETVSTGITGTLDTSTTGGKSMDVTALGYTVSVDGFVVYDAGGNAVVTMVTPIAPLAGDGTAIAITPNVGMTVKSVAVNGVAVTDNGDGTWSFTYPAAVTDVAIVVGYGNSVVYQDNGTVTISPMVALEGETVTVTLGPDDGYTVQTVTMVDAADAPVTFSGTGNTLTFVQPASAVKVTGYFKPDNSVIPPVNGTVSTSPQDPQAGNTVVITPDPEDSYAVGDVTVTDKDGNEVPVTDKGDGTFEFTQPDGGVDIEVTFKPDNQVNTPANGSVTVTPADTNTGDTVTVIPTPDSGYVTGDVVVKDKDGNEVPVTQKPDGSFEFTQPEGGVDIEVTYRPENEVVPPDNGTVTVSPEDGLTGDTVVVTPSPDDGYVVGDVTIKDGDGNDVPFTPNADGTITFEQPESEVEIEVVFKPDNVILPTENGSVTISPDPAYDGDTVIITPDPDDSFVVDSVVVKDKDGNTVPVTDKGDGTFEYVQPDGGVNIEVTFKPDNTINSPAHGTASIPSNTPIGSTITITTTPDDGWVEGSIVVTDKDGNDVPVTKNPDGSFTYVQPESGVDIVVTFKPDNTVNSPGNGTLTFTPDPAVPGGTVTGTPVPDAGYIVDSVVVKDKDGNDVPFTQNPDGSFTFTQPDGGVDVTVTFKPDNVLVPPVNGTVTLTPDTEEGDVVVITPTPDAGYTTGDVVVKDKDGFNLPVTEKPDGTFEFTQPDGGVTVEVKFTVDNTVVSDHGTVSFQPYPVTLGATVTMTVDPDTNYSVSKVGIKDSTDVDVAVTKNSDGTYTFVQPSVPVTITVEYSYSAPSYGGGGSWYEPPASSKDPEVEYVPPVIEDVVGGTVEVPDEEFKVGDDVTITITPDEGYVFVDVVIKDKDGNIIDYVVNEDGTISFVQPEGGVTIVPSFVPKFEDVADDAWYADSVYSCVDADLMHGTSATTFSPVSATSRAQVVQVFYNMENNPEVNPVEYYEDVDLNAWYGDAVTWGTENKIVAGYGHGIFDPNGDITREQLAAVLYRYSEAQGYKTEAPVENLNAFADGDEVAGWASESMRWAVANGIIGGTPEGNLNPTDSASRAEIAAVFQRYYENIVQ